MASCELNQKGEYVLKMNHEEAEALRCFLGELATGPGRAAYLLGWNDKRIGVYHAMDDAVPFSNRFVMTNEGVFRLREEEDEEEEEEEEDNSMLTTLASLLVFSMLTSGEKPEKLDQGAPVEPKEELKAFAERKGSRVVLDMSEEEAETLRSVLGILRTNSEDLDRLIGFNSKQEGVWYALCRLFPDNNDKYELREDGVIVDRPRS